MLLDTFSLAGQTGIVTGGGGRLGRAMCRALAAAGANVVIAELDDQAGRAIEADLKAQGAEALFLATDVLDRDSIQAMVVATVGKFGRIDFLVNNAGKWTFAPAEELSDEDWRSVMGLDLDAVFRCSQIVGRQMIAQREGRIINISSVSGKIINRTRKDLDLSYFAAKAGVAHLTRALAVQWARHNIRVNTISPGYMGGPVEGEQPPFVADIPMARMGTPEELGPLAVFLASEASSYLTGAEIVVDGGFTCW